MTDVKTIALLIYGIALAFFAVGSALALFNLFRFSLSARQAQMIAIVYVALSLLLVLASWVILLNRSFVVEFPFGNLGSIPLPSPS
ncbi:MAG: hypothetical protein HY459_03950 [Parcubacteria group bacterium]|nr:hypothetical protein [Parcubacteria group bacterium]